MNRPTTTKKTGEKKTAGKSEITRVFSGATVGLIDPSLEQGGQWDVNLGDNIIVESVCSVLKDLCGLRVLTKIPSLRKLTGRHYHQLKNCSYIIVGGSNLLSSNMNKYRQWMITLLDLFRLKNVILLGVGWWQYQQNPNLYTKLLLRRVLHRTRYHSVRDHYTRDKLLSAGFHNVLNTSCPTTWCLTNEILEQIPQHKAGDAITTVTCYNKDRNCDKRIIELLLRCYRKVFFWSQGRGDQEYAQSLSSELEIIPSTLTAYDHFLENHSDLDYIGTRLHGGLRALQYRKRSLILSIDNRTIEITKDTKLPSIPRSDIADVETWIHAGERTDIRLPYDSINKWIAQFAG